LCRWGSVLSREGSSAIRLASDVNSVNLSSVAPFEPDRDTRALLISAARELILDVGFDGFSMRKIASACGVSAPAIYRHFKDKDDLLSAAIVEGAELFTRYLLDALVEQSPLARLRLLGLRYFDFALENPRDYELIFVLNCRQLGLSRLDEKARTKSNGSFQILVDRVAECQRSGDVMSGSPEALALSIWAGVHGLVSLALSDHLRIEGPSLRDAFSSHQDILLRGIRP
jgi:AcrR family transcriptional regulator